MGVYLLCTCACVYVYVCLCVHVCTCACVYVYVCFVLVCIGSARISQKSRGGIDIEKGSFFNDFSPSKDGRYNASGAVIVPGTTMGSAREPPPLHPVIQALCIGLVFTKLPRILCATKQIPHSHNTTPSTPRPHSSNQIPAKSQKPSRGPDVGWPGYITFGATRLLASSTLVCLVVPIHYGFRLSPSYRLREKSTSDVDNDHVSQAHKYLALALTCR